MRILLAGASGFLGTRLAARLRADGHDTVQLVRRPARGPAEVTWSPSSGQLDPAAFDGVRAVVNLAGAGVGDKRWTDSYKALIRSSRVDSTGTLATAIAALPATDRPAVLLNSSAVGWYGDTGDQPVEEDAPAGEGFLSDVARVWEAATRPAEDAGVRVVRLRTGLPLHRDGGLLKPQLLPFRLGLGGKLGSGRQWVPWIAIQDWLSAVVFLLERDDVSGPVNVVGPNPVTNAAFGTALGAAVHRPAIMPIPAFALQIALGEFAVEALRSTRVLPGVLTGAGFTYRYPQLAGALQAALHDD
ncbi:MULTISPECIES: TIGR01777 family oxidoreductase [unclassified Solwaraspora]|uniref:TIGR01777 family oxidoreductase n=1 Tax=unclassified Solwaraspora TaxID=2627926 RepID=UPI00259B7E9A|nr:TIGR01777 family oxidoreductase [Solwaraspora sp. WMMA2056]WJK43606.1 TIGR01777 family oxidoreductase [Solwaraspora sp. WMMA2056]